MLSLCNILLFGLGGTLTAAEEEDDLINQLIGKIITTVFVEHSLVLPKFPIYSDNA